MHLLTSIESFPLKRRRALGNFTCEVEFSCFKYFILFDKVIENHPKIFSKISKIGISIQISCSFVTENCFKGNTLPFFGVCGLICLRLILCSNISFLILGIYTLFQESHKTILNLALKCSEWNFNFNLTT